MTVIHFLILNYTTQWYGRLIDSKLFSGKQFTSEDQNMIKMATECLQESSKMRSRLGIDEVVSVTIWLSKTRLSFFIFLLWSHSDD